MPARATNSGEAPRRRPPAARLVRAALALALIAALAAALLVALVYAHHLGEGDRALAAGDPAAALAAYSAAAAAAPWDPAPLDRAAQAAMAAGRYADAERSLRQLAGRAGWTADLHRRLGDALHARGEARAAVAAWETTLSADPENAGALRALADAAIQAKDWEEATLLLQRLVAAAPNDAAARYHLGLLLAPYLPEQATPHLEAAAADPAYAEAAAAVIDVLGATAGETDRAFANAQLARVLMAHEAWPLAAYALEQALLHNPRYADAMAYLGLVRDQLGEDGLGALNEAVALAPENALVRYALGRHYALAGDYDAALIALIQAASLDPENPAILAELSAAYRASGDLERAVAWLKQAVAHDEGNGALWGQLAALYADTGYDLEGAGLAAINEALLHAPDRAEVHASQGWALYQLGREADALRALQKALELDPADPRAGYYYGVLLEVTGDTESAAAAYQSVLEGAPGSRWATLAARGLDRLE